jgi:hypothetical protein
VQSNDRDEFNSQMRKFFGAYGDFPSPDRIEAYWIGLQKLTLVQLGRVMERALSEDGPEKMPNVPQVWNLHRELRRVGPNAVQDAPPGEKPIASLQEQLCAYAMDRLHLTPREIAAPWEYDFREWWVDKQRNSALSAVCITRDDFTVTRVTVAEMFADTERHARVMAMFKRIATRGGINEQTGLAKKIAAQKTGLLVAPNVPPLEVSGSIEDAQFRPKDGIFWEASPAETEAAANFFDDADVWPEQ